MDASWLAFSATAVVAHVLYGLVRPDARGVRRIEMHNGDDFTPADTPPRPDRLAGVRVVTAGGATALAATGDAASTVGVDVPADVTAPAWVVVETPPTFIELAGPKFTRYLTYEGLAAVLHARRVASLSDTPGREIYSKHTKTAITDAGRPLTLLTTAVGLPVEFVPAGPAPIALGDWVELSLVVDGRAAADQQVLVHHRDDDAATGRQVACLRTDAAGRVRVRVDATGHWRWHAVVMAPHGHRDEADWRSRWACLGLRL